MTNYREILRLLSLGISNRDIAKSVPCSRNTVASVSERAREAGLSWPLPPDLTDRELEKLLYPKLSAASEESDRAKPDFEYMRRELQKNGVTKKLLWFEYLERCRQTGEKPLMYSHFCYLFQQDEMQHDPDTGEILKAFVFIGVLSYSHYAYVEAFPNEKQRSWITAHVHMFEYFGGVAKILIPDNCMTAVNHNKGWNSQEINSVYREMAEHYHGLLFNRSTARLFSEEMLYTIEMFFKKDLNLSDTARQLYIHRNTLVYRLDKVQRQVGLDLRKFEDAVTFKMLLEMRKCGNNKTKGKKAH